MKPGDYAEILVADTGIGLNEDIRRHAFEPFFSSKDQSEGAGLGLSMVYGFARQSGGEALLHARVGGGAEASLLLPLAP